MLELAFVAYCLVSVIAVVLLYPRSPKEWLVRGSVVIALPVIGWLTPLFWPGRLYRTRDKDKPDRDVFADREFDVQFTTVHAKMEIEKELDVIPVEEALVLGDIADRRKVMLDLLKLDAMKHLDVLQKGVGNEDSETSHYAVSAIVEVKRNLTLSLQELSVRYEADRNDLEVLRAYAEVIDGYTRSGFLDGQSLKNYKTTYLGLLAREIELDPAAEQAYRRKAAAEIELGRYRDAEETASLYKERYPDKEEPYLLLIEVYYYMRSYGKIQAVLDGLKNSPVRLSHRGLTQVRLWAEGA
ncbi:hypothetical protein ACFSL6_08085 [Paenibacillus thailandensis]|uniref:Uncharacterized protein n=1 Tax=Paenibacillus thailandensis TaxID=393250 RepID=A0ABW5QVQ4_9BACL